MSVEKQNVGFRIQRGSTLSLVEQTVLGLKQAIRGGRYAVGDILPSTRSLAESLGVSRIVTRAAMEMLAREGLVLSRVGRGAVVLDRGESLRKGRVLAVIPFGYESFFQNIVLGDMANRLMREGFLVPQVIVGRNPNGSFDFSSLDFALAQGVELVCVFHNYAEISDHLATKGVPYVEIMNGRPADERAKGSVWLDFNQANAHLVAACRAAGIRTMLQVEWCDGMCDVVPMAKAAGIAARRLRLKVEVGEGRIVGVQQAAMRYFKTIGKLPDLVFFTDDNLAVGGLLALAARGFLAPDDVSVVTWSNRFATPVYTRELTRMEMEPRQASSVVVDALRDYLTGGRQRFSISFGPAWMPGRTLMGV